MSVSSGAPAQGVRIGGGAAGSPPYGTRTETQVLPADLGFASGESPLIHAYTHPVEHG